jgi:hypothetical protein
MRLRLRWDVLFVLEHDDLRRATDGEHYRLARQLHRTLVTLDRDYCDDRRFPPHESGGVIVLSAPDEQGLAKLMRRVDRAFFRSRRRTSRADKDRERPALPLIGQKIHAHPDWTAPHSGAARRRGT